MEFWQPAVIRQRKLAALTFGYQYAGQPDFGLQSFSRPGGGAPVGDTVHDVPSEGLNVSEMPKLHHLDLDRGYAVVMPSASRDDKLWPEDDWRVVFRRLRDAGCTLKLLAGNEQEAERARLLVAGMDGAEVLPRMSLTDVARLLAGSRLMVGLDSGLTHLSAALGRPTIGIYRASTRSARRWSARTTPPASATAAPRPRARRSWPRSSRRWPPNDMNRGVYTLALRAASPLVWLWMAHRARRAGGQWQIFSAERFGRGAMPPASFAAPVWVHAVSLGRRAPRSLLQALLDRGLPVLLTHITATGRAEGERLFADAIARGQLRQAWLPYDFPGATRRFLARWPRCGLLIEREIWPNLLAAARAPCRWAWSAPAIPNRRCARPAAWAR